MDVFRYAQLVGNGQPQTERIKGEKPKDKAPPSPHRQRATAPEKPTEEILQALAVRVACSPATPRTEEKLQKLLQVMRDSSPNERAKAALASLTPREQQVVAFAVFGRPDGGETILCLQKSGIGSHLKKIRGKIARWGLAAETDEQWAKLFGYHYKGSMQEAVASQCTKVGVPSSSIPAAKL